MRKNEGLAVSLNKSNLCVGCIFNLPESNSQSVVSKIDRNINEHNSNTVSTNRLMRVSVRDAIASRKTNRKVETTEKEKICFSFRWQNNN